MIQATITDKHGLTDVRLFPDQSTAVAWVSDKGSMYGNPAPVVTTTEALIPANALSHAPMLNIDGTPVTDPQGNPMFQSVLPSEYSVSYADVTSEIQTQELVAKGLRAQQVGAQIVAQVFGLNEMNLASGALTVANFKLMLADQTLANVERLLWNGSLQTALQLIQSDNALSSYFSSTQIASIEDALSKGIANL